MLKAYTWIETYVYTYIKIKSEHSETFVMSQKTKSPDPLVKQTTIEAYNLVVSLTFT